jgi:hypothetical protein
MENFKVENKELNDTSMYVKSSVDSCDIKEEMAIFKKLEQGTPKLSDPDGINDLCFSLLEGIQNVEVELKYKKMNTDREQPTKRVNKQGTFNKDEESKVVEDKLNDLRQKRKQEHNLL